MNKHIKRAASIACIATATAAALSFAACGGQVKTYTIEAEFTNLGNKSGPNFSGTVDEEELIYRGDGASNNYCVFGMGTYGASINFVIESDREVKNAELSLVLGNVCNWEHTLSAQDLLVRVDPVSADDVKSYNDEGGAWGNWDQFFLGYYYDSKTPIAQNSFGTQPFAGYYIDEFDCGDIVIKATSNDPSGFKEYKITTKLHLYKGYTSISLITNNQRVPQGADNATIKAESPVVDCIKITTDAVIDMFSPMQNQDYLDIKKACTVS